MNTRANKPNKNQKSKLETKRIFVTAGRTSFADHTTVVWCIIMLPFYKIFTFVLKYQIIFFVNVLSKNN